MKGYNFSEPSFLDYKGRGSGPGGSPLCPAMDRGFVLVPGWVVPSGGDFAV